MKEYVAITGHPKSINKDGEMLMGAILLRSTDLFAAVLESSANLAQIQSVAPDAIIICIRELGDIVWPSESDHT